MRLAERAVVVCAVVVSIAAAAAFSAVSCLTNWSARVLPVTSRQKRPVQAAALIEAALPYVRDDAREALVSLVSELTSGKEVLSEAKRCQFRHRIW